MASGGFVSRQEGEQLAAQIGAIAYYEMSALTQVGLKELYEGAARYFIPHSLPFVVH